MQEMCQPSHGLRLAHHRREKRAENLDWINVLVGQYGRFRRGPAEAEAP